MAKDCVNHIWQHCDIIERVEECRKKAKSMVRRLVMLKKESVVALSIEL